MDNWEQKITLKKILTFNSVWFLKSNVAEVVKISIKGMDEGTLIMSGLKRERVLESIKVILSQHNYETRAFAPVRDYQGGQVSKKIVRLVLSYTDYINRTVWKKF